MSTFDELMAFTKGRWSELTDDEREKAMRDWEIEKPKVEQRRHQAELEASWKRLCPPIYRESDLTRLPNLQKFQEVQEWKYGPEGLLLVGPTRRGKTRAVWTLLKRLHFQEERQILAFTPMDLKLAVANAWRDREEDQEETNLIIRLRRAQVLFLDDLDTIKFTEAVEETLYDIFEHRPAHQRPVIVTVNQGGPELAARMGSAARGEKIVARMRESCRVLNFG